MKELAWLATTATPVPAATAVAKIKICLFLLIDFSIFKLYINESKTSNNLSTFLICPQKA